MLAEERFNRILNIVEEKKSVTVTELTELLDTSESTIRRDLTTLDKRKKLIKVHGGATAVDMEYMTLDQCVEKLDSAKKRMQQDMENIWEDLANAQTLDVYDTKGSDNAG